MKNKKSIKERVQKDMPEFVGEVASLDSEALNLRLSELAKNLDAVEQAQDSDGTLEQTRVEVTTLSAPYRDAKKAIKTKSKYIISLLKDRGAQ